MSQHFETNPIHRVSDNGVLEAIGLEWTEEASVRYNGRLPMWFAFVVTAPFLLFSFIALPYYSFVGLVGVLGFGGFALFILHWLLGALPRRSVMFLRDGSIHVPHGIPRWGISRLKLRQPDLVNIEIGPSDGSPHMGWTTTVNLVSSSGRTTTVSWRLHREEAREIVVKLTRALQEMRVDVGGNPVHATGAPRLREYVD